MDHPQDTASRIRHELRSYAGIVAYLYVCLAAILLYRAAVTGEHRYGAVLYGTAMVKALVLGKFLMLGQAARLGERLRPRSAVLSVLHRSAVSLLVLVALSLLEEVVAGLIHGRGAEASLAGFIRGRGVEVVASCLLLWLVLVPYVAAQHVRAGIGDDAWRRLLRTGSSG
jgi:hypothetical protein